MINPEIDKFVRKVYAELVRQGHGTSYSHALNVTLMVGIIEISKHNNISKDDIDKFAQYVVDVWQSMDGD